jgi:hypothetical protein
MRRQFDTEFGEDTTNALKGGALGASEADGMLFTADRPTIGLGNDAYVHTSGTNHPPIIRDGVLIWGGKQGQTQSPSDYTFVRGDVAGSKTYIGVNRATAETDITGHPLCYDEFNELAYHPVQSKFFTYMDFKTGSGASVERAELHTSPNGSATPVAAAWHPKFKSLIADNLRQIWYADSITDTHTLATMPDMTGLTYGSPTAHIACTPDAALMFSQQQADATKAIQRTTDGVTWTHAPEIGGIADYSVVTGSWWYSGRLWVSIDGGLYSTDDDGDTWREDVVHDSGLSALGYNIETGKFIAWGSGGVWNSEDGETWVKVNTTSITYRGAFYSEEQRLIYGEDAIYDETGQVLLNSSNLLTDTFNDGTYDLTVIGGTMPNGADRLWLFAAASANGTYSQVVEVAYGVFVPPPEGAQYIITASGSGGTINVGTAINGQDTIVSNLATAAGGDHSDTTPANAVGTNQGSFPVLIAGAGSGGCYFYEGGEGIWHSGKQYGNGETVYVMSTAHPPSSPTNFTSLTASDRGGWSGAIVTYTGTLRDPVPMLPGQRVADSVGYERSGAGAVIVKEI